MAHALADETLHIILHEVLDVPDSDFFDISGMHLSPFGRRQFSNSTALLVCKRWMRIATPLLYHTVVLRSTAQAQSLAKVLSKAPDFAKFLMRLRLEGGFGVSVGKIMRAAAAHLRDLHISLDLNSQDNVKHMCEALSAINPSRLGLSIPWSLASNAIATRTALENAVPSWTSLRSIIVSKSTMHHVMDVLSAIPTSWDLYPQNKIPCIKYNNIIRKASIEAFALQYAGRLIIHRKDSEYDIAVVRRRNETSDPPMRNADIKAKIWASIFQHVVLISECNHDLGYIRYLHSASGQPLPPDITSRGAIDYLLVCKLFKDVCLPIALRHLELRTQQMVENFLTLINARPGLALKVEGVFLKSLGIGAISQFGSLLSRLPRVRTVHCSIGIADAEDLTTYASGLNLVELDIEFSLEENLPVATLSFPALRRLRLSLHPMMFNSPAQPLLMLHLPQLEELFFHWSCPAWFTSHFSQAQFPRLRSLTILQDDPAAIEDFLGVHGPAMEDVVTTTEHLGLVLRCCANVESIVLAYPRDSMPSPDTIARKRPHSTLKKIILSQVLRDGRISKQKLKELGEAGTAFIDAIQPNMYPALREILLDHVSWPVHPRDIAGSPIVKWADALREKGITLLDRSGTAWRSRLKYGRGG